jgi:hypothetical protein
MTHRFHLYFEPTGSSYDLLLVQRRDGLGVRSDSERGGAADVGFFELVHQRRKRQGWGEE